MRRERHSSAVECEKANPFTIHKFLTTFKTTYIHLIYDNPILLIDYNISFSISKLKCFRQNIRLASIVISIDTVYQATSDGVI